MDTSVILSLVGAGVVIATIYGVNWWRIQNNKTPCLCCGFFKQPDDGYSGVPTATVGPAIPDETVENPAPPEAAPPEDPVQPGMQQAQPGTQPGGQTVQPGFPQGGQWQPGVQTWPPGVQPGGQGQPSAPTWQQGFPGQGQTWPPPIQPGGQQGTLTWNPAVPPGMPYQPNPYAAPGASYPQK